MSLIDEDGERSVRMAHLATVGSHAVNGVAELHSDLLQAVCSDFYEMWPEKFSNKTNGVTPRRFLALSNPGLRELITEAIGDGWVTDLDQLRELEPYADDAGVPATLARDQARQQAPVRGVCALRPHGIELDPSRCSTCRSSAFTSTSAST